MLTTSELNNLTKELGYTNIEDAATKQIELSLIAKIAKYKAEDEFYRNKYKSDYNSIVKQNKSEIFELEDDLIDWKFAVEAIKKYSNQYNSLSK